MSSAPSKVTISGAPEGHDAKLVLEELAKSGCVIHVARDDRRMEAMSTALGFFAPDVPVLSFPAWDCLPYDRTSPNSDVSATRMATLAALAQGVPGPFVLLTSLAAVSQLVPARSVLAEASFTANVGGQIDEAALRGFLVRMGFTQSPTVMEPGDYAVRGGIIDIFPPGESGPVRLDLFGDVLDGARRFDPATQRTTEKLTRVELAPVSEVILDEAAITRFRQNYRIEFGAAGTDDPLYEAVSAGRKHAGIEHWLPFFHERLEHLFDYLPDASISLDDQMTPARLARWETIEDQYDNRLEAMKSKARLDTVYKPVPPGVLYLDDAAWEGVVAGRRVVQFAVLAQATGPGVTDAGGRDGRNFAPERQSENLNLFGALGHHVEELRRDKPVVIASFSAGARERLQGLLADQEIHDTVLIEDARAVKPGGVHLAIWGLEQGFVTPDLAVISEQDVLGDRLIRGARKKKRAANFLTEAQTLSPGDLVVHVDHGIGRFTGMETVTAAGAPHECILLEYAGGDRLYLPVENVELLSRYGHEEGLLDKLGGGAWQAKKARLKQRIKDMADRLIRVAAERELRRAPILEPAADMWEAFNARFPYEETEDQLTTIEAVLDDLAKGRPMDRLVCGDVGFGKTEVAMRAAFVAAAAGLQVAVVAPTTLLSRQHTQSFKDRFRGFPLNVRQLSRFVGTKEAAQTREGIARGEVDIAIGTHALLSQQVKFKNLGLLIIDEEQHFGAGDLDQRMNAFYDGKYDVLLATTIVESGIDIPTANTMIIHRADMFGLSQLYQIRGRVGRSKTRAYAYLTTKPRVKLTATAEKRLRVLGSLDSLGAGFNIASQDLDIRGAGNVLGEEQSGSVREVGYELYQSMLEEAIAKIRSGQMEGVPEADEQWAPVINLGVPVLIPEDYVADLDVRLGLYRRLSGLTTKVELEGFAAELIDRFGKLPREVNTLLLVVRIKAMCKRAGISKLNAGERGATIEFHDNKFAKPEGLVEYLSDERNLAKMKDNMRSFRSFAPEPRGQNLRVFVTKWKRLCPCCVWLDRALVFAAGGVAVFDGKIQCAQQLAEMWAHEGHGLHGHIIERLVLVDEEQAGFGEQGGLFDADGGFAA